MTGNAPADIDRLAVVVSEFAREIDTFERSSTADERKALRRALPDGRIFDLYLSISALCSETSRKLLKAEEEKKASYQAAKRKSGTAKK